METQEFVQPHALRFLQKFIVSIDRQFAHDDLCEIFSAQRGQLIPKLGFARGFFFVNVIGGIAMLVSMFSVQSWRISPE